MEIINSIPGYGTCWYSGQCVFCPVLGRSQQHSRLGEITSQLHPLPADASQAVKDHCLQSSGFGYLRYP